jgi:hypothetical protein
MKSLLIFLCFISTVKAQMLERMYVEAEKGVGTNRSAYIRNEERAGSLDMGFKVGMTKWAYSETRVMSDYTSSQFRHVGLENEMGVRLGNIDLYLKHRSDHGMDATYFPDKYPNENSIAIRVWLYGR